MVTSNTDTLPTKSAEGSPVWKEFGFYLDGYLVKQVKFIRSMLHEFWDVVCVVDGREGCGKSTFAMQLCIAVDPTFDIDRIVFSPEEFYKVIVNSKPGMAIMLDEAMTAFFSRAAMSRTNIGMVRMLAECRQKNLFLVLVLPSFFEMDRYPALHRTSFLAHIYAMPKKNNVEGLERGYFRFYDRPKKKELYLEGKQKMNYSVVKPSFYGKFTKQMIVDETEYQRRKLEALRKKDEKAEPVLLQKYRNKCIALLNLCVREWGRDEAKRKIRGADISFDDRVIERGQ